MNSLTLFRIYVLNALTNGRAKKKPSVIFLFSVLDSLSLFMKNNKIQMRKQNIFILYICDAAFWHLIFHSLLSTMERVWVYSILYNNQNFYRLANQFFPLAVFVTHTHTHVPFALVLLLALYLTDFFISSEKSIFPVKSTQLLPLISLYWLRQYIKPSKCMNG